MKPIERSALLVVDIQDSFKVGERWSRRNNPRFEANVTALIDAYRAAKLPIYFVLHSDSDGEEWQTSSPHYRLMSFLSPRESEPLLHKTSRNAFTTTDLHRRLTQSGVERIVVAGIQTEQCCETTARVGADLGYDVDFVTEATLTFPIQREQGDWSHALPAEAVVERTEYALRRRFARIATVDGVISQLSACSV